MRFYTIHLNSVDAAEIIRRGEEATFIKEGISWPALFIQVFWLVYHRLWIASLVYIAVFALFLTAFNWLEMGILGPLALTALMILFALEANDIRRYFLSLKSHLNVGVSGGRTQGDAERRFFAMLEAATHGQEQPPTAQRAAARDYPASSAATGFGADSEAVIGLFPKPGA